MGARGPCRPLGDGAIDRACLVLAALRLGERALHAFNTAVLVVHGDRADSGCGATATGLVAVGPAAECIVGAVDGTFVRVARRSIRQSGAIDSLVLHLGDD